MRPLPSATPIPRSATRTVPSGAKLVKFETAFSRTRWRPSTDRRLTTVIALPVHGWTALSPAQEPIAEAPRTASARRRKIVAGWGSAFPALSTIPSIREKRSPRTASGFAAARPRSFFGPTRHLSARRAA